MDARQYAGAEQGRGPSYDNYGYREELASRLHRDWPNGQKQIYVSQSPLYDSWSSMPGEDSSSSSINCKRCCTIFGIILLMCGIIAGIVVAIYFSQRDAYVQDQVVTGTSITPTPTIPVPQAVLKQFLVSVTTEGNYTPALNDSSSKEFKEKAQSFQKMMDNIYKNSSLAGIYKETKVLGFSQGSIKVNFVIIVIIIPTSPTPAARNVTSSPSLDNSTQKTTTTTTRLPDPNIISNVVLQALREIIKENAVIMKVDLTKNDSIQITEITTTARPTTTPIRTTPKTIFISTSQRPDATKTRLPLPTSTTIREMVTESMRPRTETPILPHTEPSKPETSEKLTSIEPQLPTKQSTSTQELAPESTKPPKQFTTAPSNTNAPASQKTFPSVTTVSNVPTLGKTTLIQDITIVTQAYSKLATTEELPTQDITDHFTSAQNSTKTSLKFSRNYTVVTLPFSTSITPIKNQTSEPGIMYTGTTIKPFMTTTASLKKPDDCNPRLTSCENGQCIRHEWFCDNHVDCLDASDEDDVRCGRNTTKQNSKPESTGNELDCNFESNTKGLCNYEASPGVYNWRVKRGSTSSNNTGPDLDHTYMSPKGHFLFTESSYGKYNDNATLKSIPVATDNRSHSFTFYYHMNGAHMGSLVVYFNIHTLKGLQRVLKWKESGNHGNMWLKACIEMPKGTKLSVEFVAYRGLNYTSDIAIDDIKYSTDSCMSVSCTYEDSNCGHMPNFENKTNSNFYTWRRVRGNVMINKLSAPKIDFTQGMQYGAFLIADSKSGNTGDKAIFRTPLIRTSKTMALNFRLYISGTRVGEMQVSLLSQPNSISNITYQRRSITQGWERICVLVPKDFVGIAEFVAVRGDVIPGYIAVDDVALGPETMCNGFSTCQFESGIYCNFNITGKDYRWRRYNALKGHYLIASGKGAEGSNSKLVSPKFTPLRNSSISIRYAIQGTSVLSIWIREYMNGIQVKKSKLWSTEEMMTGVQTMPSMAENINSQANYLIQNTNKRMDWLTSCINMPIAEEISIEIVSRKIDQEGGEVALDWVNVNMKQCQIGLEYNACNFDEPNLCGYEIECPFNTQYKWKRISGSTPTSTTGPLRDHTFNNTIGHYLYTEGSVGRTGDKAMVTFTNIQTTINTSIRFSYYMSGRDIGALYIIVGKSGKISWIQEGNKSPLWYYGCVDLPSNKRVNVSFIGIHGNGPLSDIAIDDVNLSYDRCPARHISCNFENEMICGYTGLTEDETRTEKSFDEQWLRLNGSSAILPQLDHTLNSSKGHFLATSHLSKIMSPRIAYGQTTCLQFYYYIQLGKGQAISVTADYKDSKKNKVKIFGTNGFSLARWRHGQMNLTSGNISVIFSVGQYNQEISSTIFAIDDVSISYGMCPETVCSEQMFKCKQDDICIPNYKKCDWIQDCSDGADELNCPTNRSNIRLVDGITSGDKGRVEIYVNGSWGTAYSLRWFESNAKVACRQLGYTGFSKSVRFGKFFFGLGDVWQITCIGNETSLQDCDKVNVVNTISHLYDVGLACYNSACEPGKKACPKIANSSVVYCLDSSQFCDGDIDCPGEEDEKNCSNCQANEFTCKNHMCISKTKRCDGKPDCLDASDEMNCVRKDEESNVELYYNGNWTSLCSNGSNEALYSSLCLIMGQGVAKRKTVSSSNSVGLIPIPNPSKITAIGKYNLSLSAKPCPKLKLECYEQECGKRSQKKFEPFVQYGNQAVPTEYPWQAMLLRNGNFHCGASIFNSRWLITAEHCVVEKYVTYEVVAGLLLIQDLDKFPKIKVMDIIHSMNYASHKGIPVNDIALILLEKDLVFNDYIQPVCLPSKVYTAQDYCYLSGWGRDENLVGQSHLKETKVYAISNEVCKKYYDNVTDNSFICFRHNKPNMPSCYGDSGGPLVCRNDRGRFELVGVVSFGLPLCAATNGTPAAFTNVLNFRGWIVDQTRCRMWCPNGKCLYKAEICDGIDHCTDRSDESHPKCTPTVTCDFNKPYKCGYRNDSFNTWYWSSPHWSIPYMKAKPMTGRDTETEKYMLASVNATKLFPARIISPKSTEIPCISFTYIANASNTATAVLILKVRQQNSSFDKKVWNTNKNDTHEMIIWKLMTVSLPSMTTSIIFEAYYENPTEYSFIAIDSINVLDQNCTVCHSTEFQCNTGQCINARHVCDRILHCSDGSDELNCLKTTPPVSCSSDHFQCSNGECVLKDTKCNGIKDCTDGSDENQCNKPPGPCSWDQFHCNDGQCIEDYLKCDGFWHCKDGSDEKNCHKTTVVPPGICKWNQFRCINGQCIDFHLKCDNIKQCKDGSDEQYCGEKTTVQPGPCLQSQFRCNNGQCIESFLKCDKVRHCKDGTDEQNCGATTIRPQGICRWDQFRCNDGQCIQYYLKCDQIWHCRDGSDEQNCAKPLIKKSGCKYNEFGCLDGKCIEIILVCNQNKDCSHGEDEYNCANTTKTTITKTVSSTTACAAEEFRCDERQCIPEAYVCDVIPDCDNAQDELNCDDFTTTVRTTESTVCQNNEFRCSNGQCILKSKRCDKMLDCSDNSDEENCGTTTASTKKKNITGSQLTTIKPTIEGCALDQFQCNSGSCIPISRYCDTVLDCTDGSDEICHTSTQKSTLKGCSYDDFRCDNGQCIPLSFHCDSLFDCNDRSDEKNCSWVTPTLPSIQGCGVDEFHCKNGYCIKLAFVCDGLFDCPDSSDEQDCPVTKPTEATTTTDFKICTKSEYQCPSGKCINADYVCDGIPDCSSADDEASCKVSTSSPESLIPASDKCFPLEVKECLQVGYSRSLLPNVFGDKSYTQAMERFYMEAMPIISRQCSKKALMLFCGTIFPLCKDGISKYTCKSVCREVEQSCGKNSILMDTCDWLVDDSRWCFIGLTENKELQGNTTTSKSPLYPKVQGCLKGFYQCKNSNLCLHPIHLCDGEPTCPQADDEPENCTCLSNQFRCASGQCVMKSRRCNGYQDCKDYSDEHNCSVTECVGRLCNSGQCVPSESFCDGFFDCDDLSDEKLCECKPPHRRCNNQVCVTPDKWCNREDNCGDNSDEKNCDCSTGELMCSDGRCIPLEWWCDGNRDCSDGKDESHCHNCKSDEFICTRGYKCIKRAKVCDMKWDCVDGEDEATCVSLRKEESLTNSTAILTLTVQGQTSMVCSNKWSMKWASFICKYLRHKNVKKVEFVDPPPGTTAFQQVPSHELEYPESEFIKTTRTCKTNKIVRMACNERSCGTNRHHSIKYQEYIIGGDLARRYTWPWSVSLLYLGEPMCGATLISERWLVTAAHCIVTGMWNRTKVPHYFSAVLGEVDLFKGLMNGTRIPIDKIIFPEDMKLVVFNPDPDIALLRLKDSIQPNHQIEPICMPKLPKHGPGSTCYLAGWGGTHKPGEGRRRYSNFLHEVRMIIRNTSECSTFRPQPNWEHNLCAGYLESTITGCYGDSGGGLMCWEPDNRWTLVGVLSKGRYNCAANSPNVFTKIGSMRQWIEESMAWTSEDLG